MTVDMAFAAYLMTVAVVLAGLVAALVTISIFRIVRGIADFVNDVRGIRREYRIQVENAEDWAAWAKEVDSISMRFQLRRLGTKPLANREEF